MSLTLDRMALDDVGANPTRLAVGIQGQLEGALVTTPERGYGRILVNASSKRRRRRFTIGHELGHFLSPHHVQTTDDGFYFDRNDS